MQMIFYSDWRVSWFDTNTSFISIRVLDKVILKFVSEFNLLIKNETELFLIRVFFFSNSDFNNF